MVIVAPDHRWAGLGSLSVAELQGEPLLGGESGTGTGHLLRSQLGPIANALTIVDGFGSTEAVKTQRQRYFLVFPSEFIRPDAATLK